MGFRYRIVALFFTFLILVPVNAQSPTRYTAPDGKFSLPIPDGWTVEQVDNTGVFTYPQGGQVIWLAVEAQDADSGSETAMAQLKPDFTGVPFARDEFPAMGGVWVQQVYVNVLTGKIAVTLSLHSGKTAYVAWVAPTDEATLTAITPSLVSMLVGFNFKSDIDLSDAQAVTLDEAMLSELDAYITQALDRFEIPGAAVGVVQNGQVIFMKTYGVADNQTNTPVTPDTRFMIGSVTKSMTALLFAQLVDEGVFAWDTPVVEVFPSFALADADHTAQLTMRDFLSMSSGLPRYDIPLFLDVMTPPELIADLATYPLVNAYSEAYHYNNQMVAAGGFIAAVLTGTPLEAAGDGYADLLESRVFAPLGMSNTTVNFDAAFTSGQTATPHSYDLITDSYLPIPLGFERFVIPVAPAGAVWSTIEDMTHYLTFQLGDGLAPDGSRLVSAENLAYTHTGVIEIGLGASYALGWINGDRFGQPLLQHDGGTAGFTTTLALLPEANLGVVILSNRSGGTLGDAVRDYVIELAFGLEHQADRVHAATAGSIKDFLDTMRGQTQLSLDPVSAEIIAPFIGEYERGVHIWVADDGHLMLTGELGETTLYAAKAYGDSTFISVGILGGLEAHFDQDSEGVTVTFTSLLGSVTETTPPLVLRKLN